MRFSLIFFLSWLLITENAMAANEKKVYGYIEKATLVTKDLTLSAKLDTGAKTASLNATDITETQENGKPYIVFKVPSKQGDIEFKCEYVGKVSIKVRAGERHTRLLKSEPMKRPVVLMAVRLSGEERMIRVNLTNRKRFIYPLLLGREAIIAFNGIVDPSSKYSVKNKKSG